MMRRAMQRAGLWAKLRFHRSYTDARTIRKPNQHDQIIASDNLEYMESLLKQYEEDRALVDASWVPVLEAIRSDNMELPIVSTFSRPINSKSLSEKQRLDNMRLSWMVREYERRGHNIAAVNPLNGGAVSNDIIEHFKFDLATFGFTEDDLKLVFNVTFGSNFEAAFVSGGTAMTLEQILKQLRQMYCGSIGYEFMSSGLFNLRNWFRNEIVTTLEPLKSTEKKLIFEELVKTKGFEDFLQSKYTTLELFFLSGGEALIPTMNTVIREANQHGAKSFIMGMHKRGRFNVLANVCYMSVRNILSEIEGKVYHDNAEKRPTISYVSGQRKVLCLSNGNTIDIDILPCSSYPEALNPLVLGKAKARQMYAKDVEGTGTLPILVHGDASFASQGSSYETFGFSDIANYRVGGTLHIVINNQIGSSSPSTALRATPYCCDLAKVSNAPVMHVNGDDVEACVQAAKIAARFRQQFHRDIIIDLVCYNRSSHIGADPLEMTQPKLYKSIHRHPKLIDIYTNKLLAEKVITEEEVENKNKEWESVMQEAFDRINIAQDFVEFKQVFDPESENTSADLSASKQAADRILQEASPHTPHTGVDLNTLTQIGIRIATIPKEIRKAHAVVERTYAQRKKGMESGNAVEWCQAELLALGSISLEGIPVRLTGEDVERGTFTQRHAAVTDKETNLKYFPVSMLSPQQAPIVICNSSLSEMGVSGFELGYNMENTKSFVMWEAQFGDFSNGSQVIIDHFICCSESKWNLPSSLILSLPHGYSGAGPEHSSARIERYLQLCDNKETLPVSFRSLPNNHILEARIRCHNWQICYPSTPANYFHMLRRQSLRDFAKPLVFFFSKARLRAPNLSRVDEMAKGTFFRPVIDTGHDTVKPRKLLFCSGQIESIVADARALAQNGESGKHDDLILVKVEQLAPFPWEQIADVLEKYTYRNPAVEIVWLQEEPKNMGMWSFMRPRFNALMQHLKLSQSRIHFIGRPSAASPSTGYGSVHVEEEHAIIQECFS